MFVLLKGPPVNPSVLVMFNPETKIIELYTDASVVGLGAVLLQVENEGKLLRLVYYANKNNSKAERRYHSSKLELLCVVWAVSKLRQFLLVIQFIIFTDCRALVYLNSCKSTNA